MKNICFSLLLALNGYCYGQTEDIPVPTSVAVLGQEYINIFKEQAGILGEIEKDLATKRNQFSSVSSLVSYTCSKWAELSRQPCRIDEAPVTGFLSAIGPGGSNYGACISNLPVSEELKNIFLNINTAIRTFEVETDLNTLLYSYSSGISSFKMSDEEKERLKLYIVSLNFGYHVLINSTRLQEAVSYYSNGPLTERSLWGWIKAGIKCALGTVGGAALGALAGAGAGTFTIPVVGTVSGAAVGMWGGAMAGVSQSCF